eukprot:m.355199 g.355199  ORF g.355199 m.355199 type:complete len:155 (-) comp19922_c0_seq4:342-806(-)
MRCKADAQDGPDETAAPSCQCTTKAHARAFYALIVRMREEQSGYGTGGGTGGGSDGGSPAEDGAFDWERVHTAGFLYDQPHHTSTSQEVDSLFHDLKRRLSSEGPPQVVVIARSTEDGYTPLTHTQALQHRVLETLEQVYGPLRLTDHTSPPTT